MEVLVKAEHEYSVKICSSWSEELLPHIKTRARVAVIFSQGFTIDLSSLHVTDAEIFLFEVPDGEAAKSALTLINIWNWLGAAGFTRSDLIVGVGGGAITDLAGFAAATWLRGVDWIAVPTSLAGMVDASVGGKTGINSEYGKNLIGAFNSPISVIIDSSWLTSLTDRDFSAGLAEVIKCGFIADPKILKLLDSTNLESLRSDSELITDLIFRSVKVKASVVSVDFKESYERETLNYGHTLGHAIEIDAKYQLRHGEAVSIGLVFAAELAYGRGLISQEELELHRRILSNHGLPISYPRQAWGKLYPLLALDKKSRGKQLRFVCLSGIGKTVRVEDATSDELTRAYERISS